MRIPNKFKLMGKTIEIHFVEDLRNDTGNVGEAIFRLNKINLQSSNIGVPIPIENIEKVFCHELVHFILYELGEDRLKDDERFVESFAGLLHQALTTME